MRFNRLSAEIIAVTAMAIMPIASTPIAAQVNSSTSSSAIEGAANHEARVFKLYIAFLICAALGTAAGAVFIRDANNKYLDAVKSHAEFRIEGVKSDARAESERIEKEGKSNIAQLDSDSKERIAAVESAANIKIAKASGRTEELRQ